MGKDGLLLTGRVVPANQHSCCGSGQLTTVNPAIAAHGTDRNDNRNLTTQRTTLSRRQGFPRNTSNELAPKHRIGKLKVDLGLLAAFSSWLFYWHYCCVLTRA